MLLRIVIVAIVWFICWFYKEMKQAPNLLTREELMRHHAERGW